MTSAKTTRDEIVEAAASILAEESFSQFNIGRISARAGSSRRSFFNYFRSKDELLVEVLKSLRALHVEAMKEWSDELPVELSVEERILVIFRRILAIISVPSWRGSAFIRLSGELADLQDHPIHHVIADAKRDQEKWFEDELRRGDYASPALLATQLTIMTTGLFQLQLVYRSPRLGEAVLGMIPTLLASSSSALL